MPSLSNATGTESSIILDAVLSEFPESEMIDARGIISSRPEIQGRPSIIVELAYEEFCRRSKNGETVDIESFVARFPEVSDSLQKMFELQDLVNQAPELFMNLAQPEWPNAGDQIHQFLLDAPIGKGAFSKVFVGRDESLGFRKIVIKFSRHSLREAEALGRLKHPNIVSPLGLYKDLLPGLVGIVMPFHGAATVGDLITSRSQHDKPFEQFDLQQIIKQANSSYDDELGTVTAPRLKLRETIISIGAASAAALAYAHSQGFIHCDIKPTNILVCNDGQPKLLDFNLSLESNSDSKIAGGTMAYMAPEQLQNLGSAIQITGAADIFALGATLIELATGVSPFGGSPTSQISKATLRRRRESGFIQFRFSPEHRKELGSTVCDLLENCVRLNSIERPTPENLAAALKTLLPDPVRITRRAALAISGATAAAMLLGAGIWTTFFRLTPQEHFDKGFELIVNGGSASQAIIHLTAVLNDDPDRHDARILRACAYLADHKYELAYEDLQLARTTTAQSALSPLMGFALCKMRRHSELAEFEYYKAINSGIESVDVLNNMAYCKDRMMKLDEAKTYLDQARELNPDSLTVLFNRAQLERRYVFEKGAQPEVSLIDDLAALPEARQDHHAMFVAAQLYLAAAQNDPQHYDKAIECARLCREAGGTSKELAALNVIAPTLSTFDKFRMILNGAAPPPSEPEEPVSRLLEPPVRDREYLDSLINDHKNRVT